MFGRLRKHPGGSPCREEPLCGHVRKIHVRFDRLGGEQTIAEFVNKAYDKALEEPSLRSFLEKGKAKIKNIKERMSLYICSLTGRANFVARDGIFDGVRRAKQLRCEGVEARALRLEHR